MGYFSNALVFTSAPDFQALLGVNPGRYAQGYKHRSKPFWLMDFWMPRGTIKRRVGPFCDPAFATGTFTATVADEQSQKAIETFRDICNAIGSSSNRELEYLNFAIAASRVVETKVMLFAADDEDLDLGVNAWRGSLVSFGIRSHCVSIVYHAGVCHVTPLNIFEDERELDPLLTRLRSLRAITLGPTQTELEGQELYEHPVGQWPAEHGTAAEILGLGTWDPLVSLEEDFEVVFEYAPPSS